MQLCFLLCYRKKSDEKSNYFRLVTELGKILEKTENCCILAERQVNNSESCCGMFYKCWILSAKDFLFKFNATQKSVFYYMV